MPGRRGWLMPGLKKLIKTVVFAIGLVVCIAFVADRLIGFGTSLGHRFAAPRASPRDAALFMDKPWAEGYWRDERRASALVWHPFVYWRRAPFASESINIDADGVRRTWTAANPSADAETVRVWVFGGSTVWGNGSPDEETIPSALAKLLAAENIRAEVVNFGEIGYVSGQNLAMLLRSLAKREKPDAVVFYDGFNDVFSAYQQREAGLTMNEFRRRAEFNIHNRPGDLAWTAYRAFFPHLAGVTVRLRGGYDRLLGGGAIARPGAGSPLNHGQFPMTDDEYASLAQDVIGFYAANVEHAAQLCRENDIAFYAYWQPSVFHKNPLSEAEEKILATRNAGFPMLREFYLRVDGLLADSALSSRRWFADISGAFRDDAAERFFDEIHIDMEGNKKIAALMAASLDETKTK